MARGEKLRILGCSEAKVPNEIIKKMPGIVGCPEVKVSNEIREKQGRGRQGKEQGGTGRNKYCCTSNPPVNFIEKNLFNWQKKWYTILNIHKNEKVCPKME